MGVLSVFRARKYFFPPAKNPISVIRLGYMLGFYIVKLGLANFTKLS